MVSSCVWWLPTKTAKSINVSPKVRKRMLYLPKRQVSTVPVKKEEVVNEIRRKRT